MRKIHTTLRLFFETGLSIRAIARILRVSPEVPAKAGMGDYIRRAKMAGLSRPFSVHGGKEQGIFPSSS